MHFLFFIRFFFIGLFPFFLSSSDSFIFFFLFFFACFFHSFLVDPTFKFSLPSSSRNNFTRETQTQRKLQRSTYDVISNNSTTRFLNLQFDSQFWLNISRLLVSDGWRGERKKRIESSSPGRMIAKIASLSVHLSRAHCSRLFERGRPFNRAACRRNRQIRLRGCSRKADNRKVNEIYGYSTSIPSILWVDGE